MKKYSFFALFLFFVACTEEGPSVVVPAESSFDFNVLRNTVNNSNDLEAVVEVPVSPSSLFNQNSAQVRSIELLNLVAAIKNYNNDPAAEERVTLILETLIEGSITEIARIEDLVLTNQTDIVLFQEGNSNAVLSSAQVGSLEAILDNYEPFVMVLTAQLNKAIDSNFTVELAWNVNLIVNQD